jgi:hypothetical protein
VRHSQGTGPLENWPSEYEDIEPTETITCPDGRRRVQLCRRGDGTVQFFEQWLEDREDDGQQWQVWMCEYPISGHYSDLVTAKQDASRIIPWLRNSD